MAGTFVTIAQDALHPAITHDATCRMLTGAGLPRESALMRFDPLRGGRMPPARDLLTAEADPAELDPRLARLVFLGHVRIREEETQKVALDGDTGRVFTFHMWEDSPRHTKLFPLTPSLWDLARFLEAVEDFEARRGPFRQLAGRFGPEMVEEASRSLLPVFTDADWGEQGLGARRRSGRPGASGTGVLADRRADTAARSDRRTRRRPAARPAPPRTGGGVRCGPDRPHRTG